MNHKKSYSELAKLERFLDALTNAKTEPEISKSLNRIGVSEEVLEEGSNLHSFASNAYSESNAAKTRLNEAYSEFNIKMRELVEEFKTDRKKVKIILLNDAIAQNKLELNANVSQNRLVLFDMAKTFYTVLSKNTKLLKPLSKIGITGEYVKERLEVISAIEKARATFMYEKGISQNATKVKTKAINTLSTWMSQFFSISRDAFKEEPQMLEALGLIIKN